MAVACAKNAIDLLCPSGSRDVPAQFHTAKFALRQILVPDPTEAEAWYLTNSRPKGASPPWYPSGS